MRGERNAERNFVDKGEKKISVEKVTVNDENMVITMRQIREASTPRYVLVYQHDLIQGKVANANAGLNSQTTRLIESKQGLLFR